MSTAVQNDRIRGFNGVSIHLPRLLKRKRSSQFMAKNKYKLEAVVDLRKRAKDEAVLLLSQRNKELELEQQELVKRQQDLSDVRDQLSGASRGLTLDLSGGTRASAILKHKDFIEGLREKEKDSMLLVERQIETCEQAKKACGIAVDLLAEASKELSAIEKHKENWSFDVKKRENKREQKLLDEIGSILHERSKKL